jgi:hypothetical protein
MTDVRDLLEEAVGSFRPRGDEPTVRRRVERRHRRQRVSAAVVGLGLFAALGALGWAVLRPAEGDVPGTTPMPTVTSPPPDRPAETVLLGPLPDTGVAVASAETVELVGVDGRMLATLDGFTLAGDPGAPGVWLERDGQRYSLDVGSGALEPVSDPGAIDDEGPVPALGPPVAGDAAGRWRFVIEGLGATLGQWSDDCEVPTAFWIEGSELALVTGGSELSSAPASLALGWSEGDDARETAIVLVFRGECGRTTSRPGIYRYFAPGLGRLIHPVSPSVVMADAWGTGLGDR